MRNKGLLWGTTVGLGAAVLVIASISVFAGTFSSVTPSQKAEILAQINAEIQQRQTEIQQHIQNGTALPPNPKLSIANWSNPPLAQPRIINAKDNYPSISSGIFICTNYYEAPTLDLQVLAGAYRSSPNEGVFVVTHNSNNVTVSLPSGKGMPTLTQVNGANLSFATSNGTSGTFNYQTGTISFNN